MHEIIEVEAGEIIVQQGEEGSGFFVLRKGTLEVLKDDVLLSVLMYPGTVFGEMGDILCRPRSCTVRGKTAAQISYYSFNSLDELVSDEPKVAAKIIKTLASRLDRTTQKLIDTARENPLWAAR
ncbi:MAG: cyclic nucleotide-binding domain-containing protein [Opitutales bacterium]